VLPEKKYKIFNSIIWRGAQAPRCFCALFRIDNLYTLTYNESCVREHSLRSIISAEREYIKMKKIVSLLLAAAMCLSFVACSSGNNGKVENIEVNGESVPVTDFLVEHLSAYMNSEGYLERQKIFEEGFGTDAKDLTLTRVIEVSADGLGEKQIAVHFLAVKADCDWGKGPDDYYSNILLVVDYETGEVYDEFLIDASWGDMNGTKEQQIFYMLNGPLVGEGYKGGTIIVDSETRTELSEDDISKINESLAGISKGTNATENLTESSESPGNNHDTEQSTDNAEKSETTIEITLDNWQDYFEIRPSTHGVLYNSFDEFERLDYVNWAIFLKDDVADNVTKMDDVAIEYDFRDGYFSWFEYNLDTEEFVKKDAAAEGEVDSWLKVEDSKRDLPLTLSSAKEDGCFLVFISRHISESLNDNIYSFIGEAYGTMEITRINGTLTITE